MTTTTATTDAWAAALSHLLAEPQRLRVHYQPIVDLQRGVVRGYEALARFPESPDIPPAAWFAAAGRLGCAGALESQLLQAALVARPLIVRNRFISVNLSAEALLSDEVSAVLREHPRLNTLVVELTQQGEPGDVLAVRERLDELKAAGAAIAVDDTGAGPNTLDRLGALRPQFVKLDGHLIAGIDSDEAKVKLLEELTDLAGRLDSWIVAKGIETREELDALVRLGIPLGQGFALGAPAPAMAEIDAALSKHMRQRTLHAVTARDVSVLAVQVPAADVSDLPSAAASLGAQPSLEHVPLVDAEGRPVATWSRLGYERGEPPHAALAVAGTTLVAEAARRAMGRAAAERYDAIAVVDGTGRYAGLVPIDRLVSALTR